MRNLLVLERHERDAKLVSKRPDLLVVDLLRVLRLLLAVVVDAVDLSAQRSREQLTDNSQ